MKKRIALLLAAVLAIGSLTACGGGNDGAKVKIGVGAHTDLAHSSHSIGDDVYGSPAAETTAQSDIHVAAVTLDTDGKIVNCVIDAVQVAATVDGTGVLTTDPATQYQTKNEKGADYGMAGASGIGKEWDAQAAAFAAWCKGKTADEVAAGIGADGYPTDAKLTVGCTINANPLVTAVVRACEAAVESDAAASDTLGLGMTAELSKPANAEADKDGSVQAYVNYAAVTKNAEGKVSAACIDSIQATHTWGADGVLTTDMTAEPKTKKEKKDEYGMKGPSSIGKEWFEQIEAFEYFIVGMTADEVAAIAVNDDGYPTDAKLTAGCTMGISPYQKVVDKALK